MGKSSSKLAPPLCLNKHLLAPAMRNYECDVCHEVHRGISLFCSACDYDACPTHFLANATRDQKTGGIRLRDFQCPRSHALIVCERSAAWQCDRCNRPYPAQTISGHCAECDYDECLDHRIMDIPQVTGVSEFMLTPQQLQEAKMRNMLTMFQDSSIRSSSSNPVDSFKKFASLGKVVEVHRDVMLPIIDASIAPGQLMTWGISSDMWTKPSVYDAPYVSITNDPQSDAVFVKSADIEANICSLMAKCTVSLTFQNTSSRALEGELTFPLPPQASVCAYSLDVNGEMVPASLVEAKEAERIYEAEVKKGVDPGLLQKVSAGGNTFKTRIYPLPPNGERRISITYTQPLDVLDAEHGGFTFQLAFRRLTNVTLRGEVVSTGTTKIPMLTGGCAAARLTDSGHGVFKLSYANEKHVGDDAILRVVVPLPEAHAPSVVVEKAAVSGDGSCYYAITDIPPASVAVELTKHRLGIVWDASLSRADAPALSAEVEVLKRVLAQDPSALVDVFIVRNVVEAYVNLSCTAALEVLVAAALDGATNLQHLDAVLADRLSQYDRILMFSDGQSSVGDGRVPCIESGLAPPVFCVTSARQVNYSQLQHYWAGCTGGAVLTVVANEASAASVAAATMSRAPKILAVGGASADNNPQYTQSLAGLHRFAVTGRIPQTAPRNPDGSVTVIVIVGLDESTGVELRHYKVPVTQTAESTTMVQLLWAQQRVAQLEVFPERNHDEILSLGRRFNFVTASTSLLVLETLEQHLEYSVVPNPQRVDMYKAYQDAIKTQRQSEKSRVDTKLSTVEGYWQIRKEWRKKTFSYGGRSDSDKCKKMAMPSSARRMESAMCMSSAPCAPPPPSACAPAAAMQECSRMIADEMECCDMVVDSLCEQRSVLSGGGGGGSAAAASTPSAKANATVKYWDPDTPYLRLIGAEADTAAQYQVYLKVRDDYIKTPAFYFDVAAFFLNPNKVDDTRRALGIRVLSSIAELGLNNSRILRVLAYKLHESKEYELACEVFARVALYRPSEPQSYRDLGLTLLERGWYQQALDLLWQTVVMEVPSSFSEIEVEALWEIHDCLARAKRQGKEVTFPPLLKQRESTFLVPFDDLSLDLRVTMGWDQDNVDLDLHVIEPTGEEAYYGHKQTEIGGLMSRDFTRGYGPESYVLRKAYPGTYRFRTNYYASHMAQLTGPTVAILTITTNFLRSDQKTVCTLIRLNESKDNGEIGSVEVK